MKLTLQTYIQECATQVEGVWGGSTELHGAAHLLRTPIHVYTQQGVPEVFPWQTYGKCFSGPNQYTVLLEWRDGTTITL